MKKLRYVFFVTVLALVYIHMQMTIVDLAYRGKSKEQKIRHLVEENGNETYTILSLRSASNIGHRILGNDSDLKFIDKDHVMEFSASESSSVKPKHKSDAENQNLSFLSFLSVGD